MVCLWLLCSHLLSIYDSTPHKCDSVLHILQYPRITSLDKKVILRRLPLSYIVVVQLHHILLMKPAPLSVIQLSRIYYLHSLLSINFCNKKSTRRDSNPRPSPWQGDTPPLSHSCMLLVSQPNNMYYTDRYVVCQQIFLFFSKSLETTVPRPSFSS